MPEIQSINPSFSEPRDIVAKKKNTENPIVKVAKNSLNSIQDPLLQLDKMKGNFVKALKEHGREDDTIARLCQELQNDDVQIPLEFTYNSFEAQGTRPKMEDRTSVAQKDGKIIACLCDGHGSSIIPEMVTQAFKNEFFDELESVNGNVAKAFQNIIDRCHAQVLEKKLDGGSTVVITFIENNRLYVGTLGDSEAILAIKRRELDANGNPIKENVEIAECSRVINWSSPKRAKVMENIIGLPGLADYLQSLGGKEARFPHVLAGLNVAGSVGDWEYLPGMSQRVSVSTIVLNPNDNCEYIVILNSDGIVDYVKYGDLARNVISENWDSPHLPERLCRYALKQGKSQDNVSSIAIHVKRAPIQQAIEG